MLSQSLTEGVMAGGMTPRPPPGLVLSGTHWKMLTLRFPTELRLWPRAQKENVAAPAPKGRRTAPGLVAGIAGVQDSGGLALHLRWPCHPPLRQQRHIPKAARSRLVGGRAGSRQAGLQDSSVTMSSAAWRVAPLPWADSGLHCSAPSLVSLRGDPAEGVSSGACLLAELGFWVPSCRVAAPPSSSIHDFSTSVTVSIRHSWAQTI